MKPIKLFYLKGCPFCKRALAYIDEMKAANPKYAAIEIELIEESEQAELANSYDYYYVPTFYIDGQKLHEGGIERGEVEQILQKALE